MDIFNPSDVALSNSGTGTYTFTHSIPDDGFVPGLHDILSVDIYISMKDDDDHASDNLRISLDNHIVDNAAYHFTVNSSYLQSDGLLTVKLNVLSGDFFFQQSEHEGDHKGDPTSAPEAVPEPGRVPFFYSADFNAGSRVRNSVPCPSSEWQRMRPHFFYKGLALVKVSFSSRIVILSSLSPHF